MVTDEMVEKAANAIAKKRGYTWPGTFDAEEIETGRENMRAALEAALSAQVQDVAGWHARCGELLCLISDLTESDGELFDSDDREKIDAIDADWRAGYDADDVSNPPTGWQIVPKQPTDDMLDAALAIHETRDGEDEEFRAEFKRTYRAMLAAAPAKQEG